MACKIAEQSLLIAAPIPSIWESLIQVNEWHRWLVGVQRVELLESAKPGAIGRMIFVSGNPQCFKVTQMTARSQLQWEVSHLFGTKLRSTLALIKNAEGTILTWELACEGRWEKQAKFFTQRKTSLELAGQAEKLKLWCETRFTERRSRPRQAKPVAMAG